MSQIWVPQAEPERPLRVSPRRRRLLLIEDDPDMVAIVTRAARSLGSDLSVEWSADVDTALERLMEQEYDAVLSDYMIEGEHTGFFLLEECRKLRPQARIALMSVLPLRLPPGLGVPFVPKPVTVSRLRQVLQDLLPAESSR